MVKCQLLLLVLRKFYSCAEWAVYPCMVTCIIIMSPNLACIYTEKPIEHFQQFFYTNSVASNTSCAASVPSGLVGGEVCQIEKG